MSEPQAYNVGKYSLTACDGDVRDSRGILWMWEEPINSAEYVIGVDPTMGIPGWNRRLRTRDDAQKDNAAVEVYRKGSPDVQVAEYAAPIDPVDQLPEIVNLLGKTFAGNNEDGQALVCIEVYPGPGWMTQRELVQRFGYTNLPPWTREGGLTQQITRQYGWRSSKGTRSDLWIRGTTHLESHRVAINSPWLVEEMTDCTPDNFLSMAARAVGKRHDDRVVASLIALWYGNQWALDIEPTEPTSAEPSGHVPEFQAMAISASGMAQAWNDRFAQLLGDE